jgi:hypothetical protein
MADQPSPRRRFQFRLRTLMIGVTLLAVVCAVFAWFDRQRLARASAERRVDIDAVQAQREYEAYLRRQAEAKKAATQKSQNVGGR